MAVQSLGNPQITGRTVDELRVSTQFWLQQVFNHLDKVTGLRGTPEFFSPLNAQGNTIKNVGNALDSQDVVTKGQTIVLQTIAVPQYDANGIGITNLPSGVATTDAVNVQQLFNTITTLISTATSGLTFTALAVGFSIAGGTVVKTLTVDLDLTASTVISLTGTAARITVGAGTTLSAGGSVGTIDIAATYVGQASITTLGTIGTGVWQGTIVAGQYGGTGVANTGKTITIGGNLTTSGAFASTFTMSGAFTYTFPAATSTLLANNLGITGGSTLIGDTAASGTLTLQSTSNGVKGKILVGTSAYDEVNNRLGVGNAAPTTALDVTGVITSLIGTSTGTMTNIGVSNVQTSSAGVGNGADLTDDTLFTYTLPINALNANGRSVRVRASGTFAANGNNKTVKLFFAGTAIISSGVLSFNATPWTIEYEITRIDATHVSTVGSFMANTGAVLNVNINANLVVADLTANTSIIKVTGASPTTGAANDVVGYLMKSWGEN